MSNKKSYMNFKNILSEGFFDNFRKFVKKLKPDEKKKLKKSLKVKSALFSMNKSVSGIEKALKDTYGVDVKLDKFKLSDFVK